MQECSSSRSKAHLLLAVYCKDLTCLLDAVRSRAVYDLTDRQTDQRMSKDLRIASIYNDSLSRSLSFPLSVADRGRLIQLSGPLGCRSVRTAGVSLPTLSHCGTKQHRTKWNLTKIELQRIPIHTCFLFFLLRSSRQSRFSLSADEVLTAHIFQTYPIAACSPPGHLRATDIRSYL